MSATYDDTPFESLIVADPSIREKRIYFTWKTCVEASCWPFEVYSPVQRKSDVQNTGSAPPLDEPSLQTVKGIAERLLRYENMCKVESDVQVA